MKYLRSKPLLLVVFVSFYLLLDFFHPGLPITHDGKDHVFRIASFYQSLIDGVIIPRWAANLNWGYGHPILMFLYPLPSYLASSLHSVGFSFIDSLKIVFGLGMIFSGISMYLFLREITDTLESVMGAILYMVAPYRLIDLYVRGDIGEHLAFVFIPLVFFFIVKLYRKQSTAHVVCGAFSLGCLILSHNAISLMFLPLILFYVFYLYWKGKRNNSYLLSAGIMLFFGFLLSAFFWVPGLFEGKYTLRNIITKGGYKKHFVDPLALLYGPWSYGGSGLFTVQLGIVNMLSLLFSPALIIYYFMKKNKRYVFIFGLLLYTFAAIFLLLKESNSIWSKIMLLQNFQFPWRFLAVPVFTTSLLAALAISIFPKKYKYALCILLVCIIIIFEHGFWHAKGYITLSDKSFTGIYHGTTDTGESAPIWSVRFMEHIPKARIEIISGKGTITEKRRTTVEHDYDISLTSQARIRENTLYFPGWEVFDGEKKVITEFQDPKNRGLMTFYLSKGVHHVHILFKDTKLRLLADFVSLFSFALVGFYCILKITRWSRFPLF